MKIEVLGPGCPRCEKLLERTRAAVDELGLDAAVEKVTDLDRIVSRGVLMTPALVVDGDVRSTGKVPSVAQLRELLR